VVRTRYIYLISPDACCWVEQEAGIYYYSLQSGGAWPEPTWIKRREGDYEVNTNRYMTCGDCSASGTLSICKLCMIKFGLIW